LPAIRRTSRDRRASPANSPGSLLPGKGICRPAGTERSLRAQRPTHPGWAVARAIVAQAGCIERHVGKPSAGASLCPSGQPVRSGNVAEPRHARLIPGAAWVPVPGARSEWSSGAAVIGEPGPTICRSSLDDTRMQHDGKPQKSGFPYTKPIRHGLSRRQAGLKRTPAALTKGRRNSGVFRQV
jgi:hypothetical protein